MLVIPAIDIRGGHCVRLYQGDYAQATVFSHSPAAMAQRWQDEGARWLHVVDLDGAAAGELCNLGVLGEILRRVTIPVQFGGGIRDKASVEQVVGLGVARVVLGTAAVKDEALVAWALEKAGDSIAVALDARDGWIAIEGWGETTGLTALDQARRMVALGVPRFIYTDILRDGSLTQPNYAAVAELLAAVEVPVIASGGIARLEHLTKLRELGVEGAIVGQALYTGAISLREAVTACSF